MDTPHSSCDHADAAVSRDVVESFRAMAGYRTHLWIAPFCWTIVTVATCGLMMLVLINTWVAIGVWVLGLLSAFWTLQIQHDWDEHATSLCNALERRLGLTERYRHRDTYPGVFADL